MGDDFQDLLASFFLIATIAAAILALIGTIVFVIRMV